MASGDISDMWIRDSSVQIGIYLPKIKKHPILRLMIEGVLRTQAFYILEDPYANAYSKAWRPTQKLNKFERLLGRGGWVGTRNFELDSGAYFIHFLWNYYQSSDVHGPDKLVDEGIIFDAVSFMIDTWITEQHHEEKSPYRYSELEREGKGAPSGYTGMVWSGFRPSDDPNKYGYSIPSNVYTASCLERVIRMNDEVWHNQELGDKASKLLHDIEDGITKYGIVEVEPGVKVFAYEVDGLGKSLSDFDDANLPSLMSLPLLGWSKLDMNVYQATRARLTDPGKNKYYYSKNGFKGTGSPHTHPGWIWPLGIITEALTTDSAKAHVDAFRMLLKMQCGNGLMHESVDPGSPNRCTRPEFEWANAMFVVLTEQVLGLNCDEAAARVWSEGVEKREARDESAHPRNRDRVNNPHYFTEIESAIRFSP